MKPWQWLLIAVAAGVLILGVLAITVFIRGDSLVVIENRGDEPTALSVDTANPGQFSWAGDLVPGQRVFRTARFSDNSFIAVCRNTDGIHRARGGYVTNGAPQLVTITVDGCDAIRIDVEMAP